MGRKAAGSAERPRIYVAAGLLGLAVALVGFAPSFLIPLTSGAFKAPAIVHAHGVVMFGWVALFLAQTLLLRRAAVSVHRRLGWFGAALSAAVYASSIGVALYAARRFIGEGARADGEALLLTILTDMTMFALLVGAAVLNRRRPVVHKRLMVLALIQVLGAAWLRLDHYFPAVSDPAFWFGLILADSLILVAAIYDWRQLGRVHPVYTVAGGAMFLVHLGETTLSASSPYAWLAARVAALLV